MRKQSIKIESVVLRLELDGGATTAGSYEQDGHVFHFDTVAKVWRRQVKTGSSYAYDGAFGSLPAVQQWIARAKQRGGRV